MRLLTRAHKVSENRRRLGLAPVGRRLKAKDRHLSELRVSEQQEWRAGGLRRQGRVLKFGDAGQWPGVVRRANGLCNACKMRRGRTAWTRQEWWPQGAWAGCLHWWLVEDRGRGWKTMPRSPVSVFSSSQTLSTTDSLLDGVAQRSLRP